MKIAGSGQLVVGRELRSEQLPRGWVETTLSSFCQITMGQSPPGSTYNSVKNGLPFFQGKAEFGDKYPVAIKYCSAPNKIAKANDILLSVRAPVGPTNIAIEDCCIGRGLAAISTPTPDSQKFVHYFLISKESWFSNQGSGSTFKAIGKDFLFQLPILLPPLNEQKRIVAKLDTIMPRIDAVKERLDKVPGILKRFRQSVLTAAVTGRLTEQWREKHPEVESAEVLLDRIFNEKKKLYKLRKTSKPKKMKLVADEDVEYPIPLNWKWCRLSEIAVKMSTGPFGTMLHKADYVENGIPVINPTNIKGENLIASDKMMISKAKYSELSRYSLKEGNIVIARRGDLSKCGIVTKNEIDWLCGTGSFFLEIAIDPVYFRFFYVSDYCQAPLNADSIGSTMSNLNQTVLSNVPFPLPPLEEQKEIVRQVDKLFALADKVKAHYRKAKARVDKLSQSVLAKAFRGELVPQDPTDEPAEKLLERILAEKAKLVGSKQSAGGRKKKSVGSRQAIVGSELQTAHGRLRTNQP